MVDTNIGEHDPEHGRIKWLSKPVKDAIRSVFVFFLSLCVFAAVGLLSFGCGFYSYHLF
jgi:hypothetical protein